MSKRGPKYLIAIFLSIVLLSPAVPNADPGTIQFSRAFFGIQEAVGQFPATIEVSRTGGSEGEVSVQYMTVDGGTATAGVDYTPTNGTLTWNDGDNKPQTFEVPIIDDFDDQEGTEKVSFILFTTDDSTILGSLKEATLMILDNCGPGEHWVDHCPSGIDYQWSEAFFNIEIPCGGTQLFNEFVVPFEGPTQIFRGQGNPDSSPHTIETEMVSLELKGTVKIFGQDVKLIFRAGDGVGNLLNDGPLHTQGKIEEKTPTKANSFFDVFFEIETPFSHPNGLLHNNQPCRMSSVIDRVPPLAGADSVGTGNVYKCDKAELYNENNELLGCLIHNRHSLPKGPLPVTLNSFTAKVSDNKKEVTLRWKTGTEPNNTGFFVWKGELLPYQEKCTLNIKDYKVGTVKRITSLIGAKGTKVSGAEYSYTDSRVARGNTCYVLEDVDDKDESTFYKENIILITVE